MSQRSDDAKTPKPPAASDRREAIKDVIRLLPGSVQPYLVKLYRESEGDPSRETELYSTLRSTLNTLAQEGVLSRRTFLQIAGLVVTGGLAPILYPEKAHAWQVRTGFWQNINNNPYTLSNSGTDPYWDYVVLLMNMDGANSSTVFAEESNTGKAPTITGTPYLDYTASTSSPYSGKVGSAKFNGSTDYVSFASSSAFNFGSSDFTIELWFKLSALPASSVYWPLVAQRASSQHAFDVGIYNSSGTYYITAEVSSSGSAITNSASPSVSLSTGTWYHVAFVRQGTTLRTFINGTQQASTTFSSSVFSSSTALTVGYDTAASTYLNGSIADLRIYNGVAKYTAAFTAATAPIGLGSFSDPNWGYCVLACPFENTLKDCSGKMITTAGSAALSTSAKKFGTASASFNGTSQYLSLPVSTDFNFGSSDFTIEFWMYPTSLSGVQGVLAQSGSGAGSSSIYIQQNGSSLNLYITSDGSNWNIVNGTTFGTLTVNTWHHVCISRRGSAIMQFLNGNWVATTTSSSSVYYTSTSIVLAQAGGASALWSGYIDSLRITKGYARYTASFTPPIAAFPVGKDETVDPFWTNTVLAMHMDELTDSTGRNAVTNNGSVTVSTSTYKYGTGSAQFSGSQSLTFSDSSLTGFGTGDYTIEFWINPSSSSNCGILRITGLYLKLRIVSGLWQYWYNGNDYGTLPAVLNQWQHLALSRKNGVYYFFVNGILSHTQSATTDFGSTNSFGFGYSVSGSDNLSGYIDDLRITKGIGRYTQNFTPPTCAFATSAYTYDYDPFFSYVVLLTHLDGADDDNVFTDVTGKTLSSSDVVTKTAIKKFGSASAYSTSGSIGIDASSDFAFGTGDYTVEFWAYFTSNTSQFLLFGNEYTDELCLWYEDPGTGSYRFRIDQMNNGYAIVDPVVLATGVWTHFAVVRKSGTLMLFRNGLLLGSASGATEDIACSDTFYFGKMNGYMDEFRITKGIARYQGTFVPPQAASPSTSTMPTGSSNIVTSGLVCYLDAGDINSYPSGGQTWQNIAPSPADSSSRSAYDFYLGSSSSSESSDPTFVGISGGRSVNEYFSFDGGDCLTLAGLNTAFLNSLHKTGANFSVVVLFYKVAVTNYDFLIGTAYSTLENGLAVAHNTTQTGNQETLDIFKSVSGQKALSVTVDTGLAVGAWHYHAWSIQEGGGAVSFAYGDGNYMPVGGSNLWSVSYSSPSSGAATNALRCGAKPGTADYFMASGTRIGMVKIYNRALTKAELDQNFAALRSRFGI